MATKDELLAFADQHGIQADASMRKGEIEDRIYDAGYDPVTLQPYDDEEQDVSEEQSSKSSQSQKQSKSQAKGRSGEENFVSEGSDESYEQGFWGTRDNPFDDAEFALTTGPNAPLQDAQGNPIDVDKDDHIQRQPEEQEEAGQQAYDEGQKNR